MIKNTLKFKLKLSMGAFAMFSCGLTMAQQTSKHPEYDIRKDKVLYTIGYAHLDTEWNWEYPTVINEYIKNIMTENFYLFEKYPDYVFNFTGSRRYHFMKEYYPELYKRLVEYVAKGNWRVSGSSVDESETVMSSPESIVRQVLYGNQYFKQEFGKTSRDYMLPDCFGFPASLPTILSHAGLIGFSTQKLTWGSAVGTPFNVGVWYGPDGTGLVSALNGGSYVAGIKPRLDLDEKWDERLEKDKEKTGYAFDFRYYGVGDQGGAPRENDVKHALGSIGNEDSKFMVLLTSSDQMFKDVTPEIKKALPTYTGDLLLTEHSAGSLTSQAFMKKMNRKNELLAKAAEQLASVASWKGALYPNDKLKSAWELVLASQVHDVLPGTSTPLSYEYAWNDEMIAAISFAEVLKSGVTALARDLDTNVKGTALVVYNPVAIDREDVVTAELSFDVVPASVIVVDPAGKVVPSQIIAKSDSTIKFIFKAKVPSVGLAVYDVRKGTASSAADKSLVIGERMLENEYYKIELSKQGDITSIFDKINNRELLAKPARLDFQWEKSYVWPAWNMEWEDRQKPPFEELDEHASFRIIENGPVRVALEVKRREMGSEIVQVLSLASGEAGKRLEIENKLDWQTKNVSLKASFPLTATNDLTTYNLGVGTITRGVNNPKQYEVPSKQWFDQTDASGSYGVTILEDSKYGSDKPDANTVRLTLMFTPRTDHRYLYQNTQDWGIHEFKYGVYAHKGDWKEGLSSWQGEFLNQPLIAFGADKHKGKEGKSVSFLSISTPQVGLMAYKKAEESDYYIVRVNELLGKDAKGVTLTLAGKIVDAYEVNGQEEKIGGASFSEKNLTLDLGTYAIKSYAVKLAPYSDQLVVKQTPVALPYNLDAFSFDTNRDDGNMDGRYSMPAELIPAQLVSEGITFNMGSLEDEEFNAVNCKGQKIDLPQGDYNAIYILAASTRDTKGDFIVDSNAPVSIAIQNWTGYVGLFYNRRFEQDGITVKSIDAPFVKGNNIAWFASHKHLAYPSANRAYEYSYIYKYKIEVPKGAKSITLPDNSNIRVFAITAVHENAKDVQPAQALYEDFSYGDKVDLR